MIGLPVGKGDATPLEKETFVVIVERFLTGASSCFRDTSGLRKLRKQFKISRSHVPSRTAFPHQIIFCDG